MNIVVTGGAGYVGYSACSALAKKYPEAKIIIYDNFSKARLENLGTLLADFPNIVLLPWERSDIRDYNKFEVVLKEYKPEIVVHLAAIVDAFTSNREGKDVECNIINNLSAVRLAEMSKEHGVKTFIFQSTVSLYSRGENVTEDSPKEPISVYGSSKLEAEEKILKLDSPEFNTTALRSATIVGYNPSFRYETIINMICIRSIYGMETTLFQSALKNPKSYLSLEDESAAIIFAIENIQKMKGGAYNLRSFSTTLEEVVKAVEEAGVTPVVRIGEEKTINQQVYTVSADKIKELGFTSTSTMPQVVKETVAGILAKKKALDAIKQ